MQQRNNTAIVLRTKPISQPASQPATQAIQNMYSGVYVYINNLDFATTLQHRTNGMSLHKKHARIGSISAEISQYSTATTGWVFAPAGSVE
jgi:hypothetical protein